MKKPISSKLKKIILGGLIVLLSVVIGLLGEAIGNDLSAWLTSQNIHPPTIYIVIALATVFCLALTAWSIWTDDTESEKPAPSTPEAEIQSLLAQFQADLLKRYQARYDGKLDGRFEITLEVSEDWRSDKPQTHKFDATAKISNAMDAIREAFNEKGRLLIVGSPGSGKTVLLLKLAIEILKNAKPENGDPFPVIFNLASWREDFEKFEDWLVDVLNSGNGLSKDFARELLNKQKIILFLDGLDELARNEPSDEAAKIRANCMASLNAYLTRGREAVVCCRREEFTAMQNQTTQDAPVSAKVDVLDLTTKDVKIALREAKQDRFDHVAAEQLENLIKTHKNLLKALCNPTFFVIALDVFDQPITRKIAFPKELREIQKVILKKYVARKLSYLNYSYKLDDEKIELSIRWLAKLIETKTDRTFELADLQPHFLAEIWRYRFVVSSIVGVFGYLFGGLVFGLLGNLTGGLLGSLDAIVTEESKTLQVSKMLDRKVWVRFLVYALLFGTVVGAITFKPFLALFVGLFVGLVVALQSVMTKRSLAYLSFPYGRFLRGWFGTPLKFGVIVMLLAFLTQQLGEEKVRLGFLRSEIYYLLLGMIFGFLVSPLFRHLILRIFLHVEGILPFRCVRFLDNLAAVGILEKEGGHWRFRHQNLQDHFAKMDFTTEARRTQRGFENG